MMSAEKSRKYPGVSTWFQLAAVLALSPFFVFPSEERTWVFAVAAGVVVIKTVLQRKLIERTALDWPILLLLLQVLWSALRTSDWTLSLPKIAGIVFAVWAYYAVVEALVSREMIKKGMMVFLAAGFALTILGFLGMKASEKNFSQKNLELLGSIADGFPRVNFNLPGAEEGFNPNAVAGTMVLFFPMMCVATICYIRKQNQDVIKKTTVGIYLAVVVLVEALVLLLAASRGSWAALFLTLMLIVGVLIFSEFPLRRFVPYLIGAVIFFVLGYAVLSRAERIEDIRTELTNKYWGRDQAWSAGIDMIRDNPLTGVGMNHVRLHPGIGFSRAHVHNHLLHTAAELGIPALAAYLAILVVAAVMCIQVWRKSRDKFVKAAILGLGAGQFAHFIFGLGDSIPLGAKPGIFFWLSLALISSLYARDFLKLSQAEAAASK